MVDLVVDLDAVVGHDDLDLGEHVTGQLDVAQNVGDILGVHGAGLTSTTDECVPLVDVDTEERHAGRRVSSVDTGSAPTVAFP